MSIQTIFKSSILIASIVVVAVPVSAQVEGEAAAVCLASQTYPEELVELCSSFCAVHDCSSAKGQSQLIQSWLVSTGRVGGPLGLIRAIVAEPAELRDRAEVAQSDAGSASETQ